MSSKPGAGPRLLGSLRSQDGRGIVRMEDLYGTDIDDLWVALTDPERLAGWLGEIEGDLRVGGEFRAVFFASGWEGTGRVEACESPARLLVRTWDLDAPNGEGELTIEAALSAESDKTRLVVEEAGMPAELLPAYGAGVQIHMEDLAAHIAGRERCDAQARWQELFPAYEAQTPEAS